MFGTPDVYFYTLQRFCRKFFQSYFNTAQRAVVEVLDAQISIFLEFKMQISNFHPNAKCFLLYWSCSCMRRYSANTNDKLLFSSLTHNFQSCISSYGQNAKQHFAASKNVGKFTRENLLWSYFIFLRLFK